MLPSTLFVCQQESSMYIYSIIIFWLFGYLVSLIIGCCKSLEGWTKEEGIHLQVSEYWNHWRKGFYVATITVFCFIWICKIVWASNEQQFPVFLKYKNGAYFLRCTNVKCQRKGFKKLFSRSKQIALQLRFLISCFSHYLCLQFEL